jgi:retinoid hydroxylase
MDVIKSSLPPGSFGFPLIGESIDLILNPSKFAEKRFAKYGPIFKTKIFGKPTIYVKGGDAIRFITSNEHSLFINELPPSMKLLLGTKSLSMQVGSIHKSRRRHIYQAFSPRNISNYNHEIDRITQQYLNQWSINKQISWYSEIKKYTFDVACKFLIGKENASNSLLGQEFDVWSKGLFSFTPPFPWTKLGKAIESRTKILSELEQIVTERKSIETNQSDALSVLLVAEDENGERLEIEEIKDQILSLLFAGHETLTSALCSFCLNLGMYPEILEKCRNEQNELGNPTELNPDVLNKMPYLEQVLVEVLRHTPPVGGGFKKVIKTCEFSNYILSEGWNVFFAINETHKDANIYRAPTEFNPERLNNTAVDNLSRAGQYAPFGAGMRECIGKEFARLEMKIFAARLLQEYKWEIIPQNIEMDQFPVPHPKDGLVVNFSRL